MLLLRVSGLTVSIYDILKAFDTQFHVNELENKPKVIFFSWNVTDVSRV